MTTALQILLGSVIVGAPWWWGGVTARSHFYLGAALVGVAILRWIQNLLRPASRRPVGIPLILLVPVGWLLLGGWQLVPSGDTPALSQIRSAPLSDLVPGIATDPEMPAVVRGVRTLSLHATRLTMAQIAIAILAFWLSFDLFAEADRRRKLSLALALNGLAITVFGIAQQLTWNGQLFWTIPLRDGGSPFGPFVNRNNAAGYLLLTLACALSRFMAARYSWGLAQTSPRSSGSWRTWFSERISLELSHLTPDAMLPGASVAVIALGILMSQSRAGAVSLLVTIFALIPILSRWRLRSLLMAITISGSLFAAIIWGGLNERLTPSLRSLSSVMSALQGRVEHWREVIPLIRDFLWTGCGWGTYPQVNPVYLSRNQGVWFQHAENQYLEVMSETGLIGLGLLLSGWGLLFVTAVRAIRFDREGRQFDSGVCGLLIVTGISIISLTDFSLSVGSIALTFSVLAGLVSASLRPGDEITASVLSTGGRPRASLAVSTLLLLGSCLALLPLRAAADIEVVLDDIPVEESLPTWNVAACDERLSRLEAVSLQHPEHSEVWAAIGNLRVYRYRRALYDEWRTSALDQSASESRRLWGATHLERLDALLSGLRSAGDTEGERELLRQPHFASTLPAALVAFDHAVQIDPLQRSIAMKRAWLSHLLNRPATTLARDLAAFAGTSEAQTQFEVGQLSQRLGQPEAATRSWKRCLELSDEWSTWVWNEATLTRDEAQTLKLYPRRLEPLLRLLPLSRDLAVRREILDRCESLAAEATDLSTPLLARLHVELGHLDPAAETYLKAIRETPFNIDLRLEASYVLEQAGRQEQAVAVIGVAHHLAPERSDVTTRWESLALPTERSVENTHIPD